MPCHNWSIKIWYLWSRKISLDNTLYITQNTKMKIQQLILVFLSSYFIAEADAQNSFSPFSFINSFLKSVPGWPLHHNRNALKNELSTINLFECFLSFWSTRRVAIHFLRHSCSPVKQQRSTVQQLNQKTQKTSFFRPHLALGPSITHSQVIIQHKSSIKDKLISNGNLTYST